MNTQATEADAETASAAVRVFPAKEAELSKVLAFVTGEAEKADFALNRLPYLEFALEEVFINICRYAYEVPPGEVRIHVEDAGALFRVVFLDTGQPFDPLKRKDPDTTLGLEQRNEGGLGIFLTMRLVDEISYQREHGRNMLRLGIAKNAGGASD
jgi:anti-sigma regulatory factor (Ser/Thr protein kinase)